MKRMLWVLLAATAASAAPLQRADISADPAWILHVDCDALRKTYLGQYLLYQLDKPEVNSNMLAFQSIFSFDIRTQLHGFTVYSDGPSPRDNIAIVYADPDPDRLISLVQKSPSPETITNRHHLIYSWIDTGNDAGIRKYAAFEKSRFIVSQRREALIAALGVIDGHAPTLAVSKTWPELGHDTDGPFFEGCARQMGFLESFPNAALLKMARQIKLRAREADEQLSAVLTLEAPDEQTASQMSVVAQGLIAMLSLEKDNPKAARLASSLSVKHDGAWVTTAMSIPSTDFVAAIKTLTSDKTGSETATK